LQIAVLSIAAVVVDAYDEMKMMIVACSAESMTIEPTVDRGNPN
jgi:hypothetical protein